MSIREKEERLQNAARNWEQAAEEYAKAGDHAKAAEARASAARSWEDAEKVHPIGFLNAIGRRAAEEHAWKLGYDPNGRRIRNN